MEKPDMRPNVRPNSSKEISPQERARIRAAQIRENLGDLDEGTDEFYIDPSSIPDGWSYEWKRLEVLGKPDPAYQVGLARKGWEPVPAERHPEMMPLGTHEKNITRKGMILMERPLELTEEARAIDERRAKNQVRTKEEQLNKATPGQFERKNKTEPLVKIKKAYEQIPIE